MKINSFDSEKLFIEKAINYIGSVCDGKNAYISLCGGSTPGPIYKGLANSDIDLTQTIFFQGDERYISKDDELSNYKLITDSLLSNKSKSVGKFYFFDTSLKKEDCLVDYTNKLNGIPNREFDLTILGIGPDGHIASIFPHSEALDEYEKLCIATHTDVFDVKDRLSISLKMILNSKKIMVLLKGENKKDIVHELEKGKKKYNDFPAILLQGHLNVEVFYLKN